MNQIMVLAERLKWVLQIFLMIDINMNKLYIFLS
jgi:hypothetical protein